MQATVRSTSEWRANSSSMWSRNPIPVATSARPWPSRSSFSRMSVSRVVRTISAVRGEALKVRGPGGHAENSRITSHREPGEPLGQRPPGSSAVDCNSKPSTGRQSDFLEHRQEPVDLGVGPDADPQPLGISGIAHQPNQDLVSLSRWKVSRAGGPPVAQTKLDWLSGTV